MPSGMRALADYLHSRDLKLGLYTDIGNASCGDGPGSYGHYAADAVTFSNWQIDALKVDFCDFWFIPDQLQMWVEFRDAINATGESLNNTVITVTVTLTLIGSCVHHVLIIT